MNKIFYPLLCAALLSPVFAQKTAAQCGPVAACTQPPDTICGLSTNHNGLWNKSYWFDPVHESHDLPEATAALCITATDTCPDAVVHLRYQLFLDLDGNGTQETVIDSDQLPPTDTVFFGNALNAGYAGGEPREFDNRLNASGTAQLPLQQRYRFALETTSLVDGATACVRWNTQAQPGNYLPPQLPYGAHRIRWIATNGLGDTTECTRSFTVRDCKVPTVACSNNLSINIMPTGMITLWATDFLLYADDNATPFNQLEYAVRKTGSGTGFPGMPSITFDCDELGVQPIELWARDRAGNTALCQTALTIQDPFAHCGAGPAAAAVCVKSYCNDEYIEEVDFEIDCSPGIGLPNMTTIFPNDSPGCFSLTTPLPLPLSCVVAPLKDDNYMNGVSTFDLVLMSKHVLGLQLLDNPYKIIAADINRSNTVSTFDIVELRRLIIGIYTELPNNTSWRFIDASFQFGDPANPLASAPFPESLTLADVQEQIDDFIGIKIGDINCDGQVNAVKPGGLEMPDLALGAGETAEIPVRASEAGEWLGFQFALRFDTAVLVVEQIADPTLKDLDAGSFGLHPGRLAASWAHALPQPVTPELPLFKLRIRALQPLVLHEALTLETSGLAAESYNGEEARQPLVLSFSPATGTVAPGVAPRVSAPQPNPTAGGALLPLQLPEAADLRLEIVDFTGKALFFREIHLPPGFQTLDIPAEALPHTGLYGWRVSVNGQVFAGRILKNDGGR